MARTCLVLHSRGTPGGFANPFSAVLSSRASWRSVLWICNSRHRPCTPLRLCSCNYRRDCDARSAHLSMGKSEKLGKWIFRSEEHTSELQSQSNLVCRLLLEKKKNRE